MLLEGLEVLGLLIGGMVLQIRQSTFNQRLPRQRSALACSPWSWVMGRTCRSAALAVAAKPLGNWLKGRRALARQQAPSYSESLGAV